MTDQGQFFNLVVSHIYRDILRVQSLAISSKAVTLIGVGFNIETLNFSAYEVEELR